MLRAWRPDRFKTPGTQVNIGTKGDVFVLTEDQRHELMQINREFLLSTPPPEESSGDSPLHNANDLQLVEASYAGRWRLAGRG